MRKIVYPKALLNKIAEHLFLAFTDQQIAYIVGISERTYHRIKASPEWQEIKRAEFSREAFHRARVWKGDPGWQGAAWMLERKYASQLAKPEIQLSLNTGANVTNNTLVITAEQAQGLRNRNASLSQELDKLSPPVSRDRITGTIPEESKSLIVNESASQTSQLHNEVHNDSAQPPNPEGSLTTTIDNPVVAKSSTSPREILVDDVSSIETRGDSVVLEKKGRGAAPTRTPDVGGSLIKPNLPQNSKSSTLSSNYRPGIDPPLRKKPGLKKQEKRKNDLENFEILKDSSNNKISEEIILKRKPGRPKKNV